VGPRAILDGAENLTFTWVQTSHHVSDSFSVHRQESSTVHTAIGICHTGYADCLLAGSGWNSFILIPHAVSITCMTYVLLCVQCWTPDDGQRNCPKHIEFYSKNIFEKLVHLAGFIIKMYHEARSSECQTHTIWPVVRHFTYYAVLAHNMEEEQY
jgi:hypothetical protein